MSTQIVFCKEVFSCFFEKVWHTYCLMNNRFDPVPREPAHQIIIDLLKPLRKTAQENKRTAIGHFTIESDDRPPHIIMCAAYPNGDYLAWFNDTGKFTVYALVNENVTEIASFGTDQTEDMQTFITDLRSRLGFSSRA